MLKNRILLALLLALFMCAVVTGCQRTLKVYVDAYPLSAEKPERLAQFDVQVVRQPALESSLDRSIILDVNDYVRDRNYFIDDKTPDFVHMPLTEERAHELASLVRAELESRGFTYDAAEPDFVVQVDGRYGPFYYRVPAEVREEPVRHKDDDHDDEEHRHHHSLLPHWETSHITTIHSDGTVSQEERTYLKTHDEDVPRRVIIRSGGRESGSGLGITVRFLDASDDAGETPFWDGVIVTLSDSLKTEVVLPRLVKVLLDEYPDSTGKPRERRVPLVPKDEKAANDQS